MAKRLRKSDVLGKLILSAMVIGMFAFSLNIPTPVVVQKDAETAFPCQYCPCGCENADQCWDSCCCFSDVEKLAWAQAHQVIPPAWFLERMSAPSQVDKTASKGKACCCCHPNSPAAVFPEPSRSESSRRTIAVRTTVQQLLGCLGKQELLKKQIVYILAAAQPPAAASFWKRLPVISESASNLAILPPIPPS